VIFFRDQQITPEQHLAAARHSATIDTNRFGKPVDGCPQIAELRKEADQTTHIGGDWHTDHSYDKVPAMGSLLLACEVPPHGGDTLFANMALAYETLSTGLKKTLDGLPAVHSTAHVFGAQGGYAKAADLGGRIGNAAAVTQDVVHPVVIRHPDTGRRTLYVNAAVTTHFEGRTAAESAPLLKLLYEHASKPESAAASSGNRARWPSGTTAPPGTTR
jgi:taurine dioxygenase